MKKVLVLSAILNFALCTFNSVMAGGLVTNSNQNVAFLRQMSQDGTIDITGLYLNPAGTAFLKDGWHVSVSWQNAKQSRDIVTDFPLFQYNQQQPYTPHEFKGEAYAPVLPSFQLSYNHDKWSLNANFALNGGGGKCEFDQGLGSFEALYSGTIYSQVAKAGMTPYFQGYSLDAYMKGRQYYFGLTLGSTYKFRDNLAGFIGLRTIYATCNYNGYVQDVKYTIAGNTLSANSDLALNCDQTGFGVAPILGIDWEINKHWNVAAKYEFQTRMNLKNSSQMSEMAKKLANTPDGEALGQFKDGEKVREDVPALLALGVQYSPIEKVRINAAYHQFFDKCSKKIGRAHV